MSAKIAETVPVLKQILIPFGPNSLCSLGAKFILMWDVVFRNKRKQKIRERYVKGKPVIFEEKKCETFLTDTVATIVIKRRPEDPVLLKPFLSLLSVIQLWN